jgi:hypothetical protein
MKKLVIILVIFLTLFAVANAQVVPNKTTVPQIFRGPVLIAPGSTQTFEGAFKVVGKSVTDTEKVNRVVILYGGSQLWNSTGSAFTQSYGNSTVSHVVVDDGSYNPQDYFSIQAVANDGSGITVLSQVEACADGFVRIAGRRYSSSTAPYYNFVLTCNDSTMVLVNGSTVFKIDSTGATLEKGVYQGSGAGLTNLDASNLSFGVVPAAQLPASVVLLTGTQTITGAKAFTNNSNIYHGDSAYLQNVTAGTLNGTLPVITCGVTYSASTVIQSSALKAVNIITEGVDSIYLPSISVCGVGTTIYFKRWVKKDSCYIQPSASDRLELQVFSGVGWKWGGVSPDTPDTTYLGSMTLTAFNNGLFYIWGIINFQQ